MLSAFFTLTLAQVDANLEYRAKVVYLTNLERRKENLPPLKLQPQLMKAAQLHAEDMANRGYFSHVTPEGVAFDVRCKGAGYGGSPRGENIAAGFDTPDLVVKGWMNSSGHRENILTQDITEIGLGFTTKGANAVMNLGVTDNLYPLILESEAPQAPSLVVGVYIRPKPGADKMRFSTDGKSWGEWKTFSVESKYTLSPGADLKTVYVQVVDKAGSSFISQDSILGAKQVVPAIVFPVLGKVSWSDTYGAPRDGGARKHEGQDLMVEKLRPALACFDGVWTGLGITGVDGTKAAYYHLNNDNPGTDDAMGGDTFMYAPGVWAGVPVVAGQFVAYTGDSGNAEETAPHLHFELHPPGTTTFNPFEALKKAKVLEEPVVKLDHPELLPVEGQVRWDCEVWKLDEARGVAIVHLSSSTDSKGVSKGVMKLTRKYIKLNGLDVKPEPGDFMAVLGVEPPEDQGITATGLKVFRNRFKDAKPSGRKKSGRPNF